MTKKNFEHVAMGFHVQYITATAAKQDEILETVEKTSQLFEANYPLFDPDLFRYYSIYGCYPKVKAVA